MHDFGYVALNMKYVYPEDSGTYTCRAINELGQAVTSSQMICQCKFNIMIKICSWSGMAVSLTENVLVMQPA